MGWTGWKIHDGSDVVVFKGFKTNINVDQSTGWVHYLVAPADEPNPNENHIHVKIKIGTETYVVAAVKVNGIREINRRKLIEGVNRATGLNIRY
ncbi:MAG: hypothetical protein ABID64_03675 [Nitrospirota bacterium]